MFRKVLITSIATIGLVSAMQANAHMVHKQSNNHHHNAPAPKITYNINVNINLLLTLITNGVNNNSLSHHEERLCRQDYKRITQLRTNYSRGGIEYHEHRQLETHIRNAQKRVKDYSRNGQRRVMKKKHKPQVHHHQQPVIIHKPVIRWAPPARKHRKHRKQRSHRGSRMNRHQRGSRMNRHQRGQMRCSNRRGGNRCGNNRRGVTIKNRHGAIRFNKNGIKIRINH